MKFCSLAVILCLLTVAANGCLNDYVSNKKAHEFFKPLASNLREENLVEPWEIRAARLQKEVDSQPTLETRNDLAVALLHLGKASESIAILEQIEREAPEKYQTATNLGTAYELAGRNEEALWWIEEGVRRNAHSHQGSEWIHIALLQKKIEFATTGVPSELYSILGISDQRGPLPLGNNGQAQSLDQVMEAIKAQLEERIPFVKPPDYYVGSLLWDLGRLYERKTREPGASQEIYVMALSYLHSVVDSEELFLKLPTNIGVARVPVPFSQRLTQSAPYAFIFIVLFPLLMSPIAFVRYRKNLLTPLQELLVCLALSTAVVVPFWVGTLLLEGLSDAESTVFLCGSAILSVILAVMSHRGMRKRFPLPLRAR